MTVRSEKCENIGGRKRKSEERGDRERVGNETAALGWTRVISGIEVRR